MKKAEADFRMDKLSWFGDISTSSGCRAATEWIGKTDIDSEKTLHSVADWLPFGSTIYIDIP